MAAVGMFFVLVTLVSYSVAPISSLAQDPSARISAGGGAAGGGGGGLSSGDGSNISLPPIISAQSIQQLLVDVVEIVLKIAIPIAAMFIIYAGFLFVSARGNQTKIDEAKAAFFAAIIGTAILLGTSVIIRALKATVESLGA